jgi:putative ABC transport system ATP-binding protein
MQIEAGEYIAITGPSGSGKSTLLHILGCLDSPTEGQYFLDGQAVHGRDLDGLAGIRNRSIGFVFQNFNLLPRLTLSQNVELPLLYAGWAKPQRRDAVATILQKLGIENRARHRPHEISGGQRQRAAIARALVKKPAFVLADEPTGNLDSDTTREILDIFDGLHREGITLLVITHEAEVASRATRRLLLRDGRFVDSPDSVNPQTASPS